MYEPRDADQTWMGAYIKFMEAAVFKRGVISPGACWNARRERRGVVHGDDLAMLGQVE